MVFENLLTSLTVFQSSFLSRVLDTEGLGDISEEAINLPFTSNFSSLIAKKDR